MKIQQSKKYQTKGKLDINRQAHRLPYKSASNEIISLLNSQKGVLLSSSFEFPGRYTRWDIGFINPPLMIVSKVRTMVFSALNDRGKVLLKLILPTLRETKGILDVVVNEVSIELALVPAQQVVYEENRSRQVSVFSVLREIIGCFCSNEDKYLGLYGAFGYDLAFQFEALSLSLDRSEESRDMVLYLPDEVLVVDHQRELAMSYCYNFSFDEKTTLGLPRSGSVDFFKLAQDGCSLPSGDHEPGEYAETVSRAREYFSRGNLFETVPGQLFFEKCQDKPSDIFVRLQNNNPAPYGALMNLGEQEYLIAASPEMYVRVENGRVETCPIAGTISRGKNAIEDARQIQTLLNSSKDESELSMCTDVDRNDKSRICEPGSINVIGRRQLEIYSRLIHTVDHVEGKLKSGFDALDAFLTHAWAVTVTGAPKKAAMQFIEDHEKSPRRWYGGAMGYLAFNGEMNTGLTLRTMRVQNGVAEVRAGATLLYDSIPEEEEKESRLKASALLMAIRNSYDGANEGVDCIEKKKTRFSTIKALMVDHQDSFVHTLSSYFQSMGVVVKTVRSGQFQLALSVSIPDLIILSPGPGRPEDFSLQQTIQLSLEKNIPIFGVCLGLQGIGEYFGGELRELDYPMHGKSSIIRNAKGKLFNDLQQPFVVGRYHSLVVESVPACLEVTAQTDDGEVMALEHKTLPILAVQFHPESILSMEDDCGRVIVKNALEYFFARVVDD